MASRIGEEARAASLQPSRKPRSSFTETPGCLAGVSVLVLFSSSATLKAHYLPTQQTAATHVRFRLIGLTTVRSGFASWIFSRKVAHDSEDILAKMKQHKCRVRCSTKTKLMFLLMHPRYFARKLTTKHVTHGKSSFLHVIEHR